MGSMCQKSIVLAEEMRFHLDSWTVQGCQKHWVTARITLLLCAFVSGEGGGQS